jgi:hypothetical protein
MLVKALRDEITRLGVSLDIQIWGEEGHLTEREYQMISDRLDKYLLLEAIIDQAEKRYQHEEETQSRRIARKRNP